MSILSEHDYALVAGVINRMGRSELTEALEDILDRLGNLEAAAAPPVEPPVEPPPEEAAVEAGSEEETSLDRPSSGPEPESSEPAPA